MLLDLYSGGYAFPGDCSVVIIAREYLENIDLVLRTVEKMITIMKATPMAIFVALEDSKTDISNIPMSFSKLPPLVNK